MKKRMGTMWIATMMLSTMAVPSLASAATPFTDLGTADSWAQNAIAQAQTAGLFAGDPDGAFRPLDFISREEMAAVFTRVLGAAPMSDAPSSYTDVTSAEWAHGYIETMKTRGLLVGDANGSFRPGDNITREELASLAVRAAGKTQTDISGKGANLTVGDKDFISDWAKDYVQVALDLGLVKADGTNFDPQKPATREEVAVTAVAVMGLQQQGGGSTPEPTPAPTPDPVSQASIQSSVNEINNAFNADQLQTALEGNAAVLNLDMSQSSDYMALTDKAAVANTMLNARATGFGDAAEIKKSFDTAVQAEKNIEAIHAQQEAVRNAITAIMNTVTPADLQALLEQNATLLGLHTEEGSDYAKLSNKLAVAQSLFAKRGADLYEVEALRQAFTFGVDAETAAEGL
ncbi:S-layer homology domain-containing protein [Tumebacillus sp. ITR2]|uniref:S-layer homology domain-containing protein n=1 Tax=Tumebacillus amylolyticus TaxID=2801339 RepID=A0ABS1JGE3_9BACL|nr:S-layer homology domain-containing protein [Tumebacillus amylolyticus]MBL0389074.1 S-layer homology domain-containing protein [Tumebacillus amylolyticus]